MEAKNPDTTDPTWKAQYSILAVGVVIAALFTYGQTNPDFLYLLSNGLPPFVALAAVTIAAVALVKNGVRRGDRLAAVWLGYTSGMLLWFSGELIWAVYSLGLGIPIPYPSLADGFWLAGYLPFAWALLLQAWPFRDAFASGTWLSGWSRLSLSQLWRWRFSCRQSWRKSKKL